MKTQYIRADLIKMGPMRRESLSFEQMMRATKVCEILAIDDVDKFIEGFCHDLSPSTEIGIWEGMAKIVHDFSYKLKTPKMRKEASNLILRFTLGQSPKNCQLPQNLQKDIYEAYLVYVTSEEYIDLEEDNIMADWNAAGINSKFTDYFRSKINRIEDLRHKNKRNNPDS